MRLLELSPYAHNDNNDRTVSFDLSYNNVVYVWFQILANENGF